MRTETRAVLDVSGRWNGTIESGDNQYRNPPEPSREIGLKTDWLRGEDLYVIADDVNPTTHVVYVKVLVKPLVNLIWVAGIVFLLGSAVASVAGRPRAAPARDATRARARVTVVALALGVALAASAVLLVALPFLREPIAADDRLDAPTEPTRSNARARSRSATVRSERSRSSSSTTAPAR